MGTGGRIALAFALAWVAVSAACAQTTVRGTVLESSGDSGETPLAGANVRWLGTTVGTVTDGEGAFALESPAGAHVLLVTCVGYRPDTIHVKGSAPLRIILEPEPAELGGIDVVGQRSPTVLDYMSPAQTQVMSREELYKAACCNLSESFETNPSIDVAFTDAVTGTRQIEMLGLAGTYTQITQEAMPGIRGLTSNVGLSYLPGAWIDNIQVSKGVGSVANGYEAITGQINVELRKPTEEEDPRVFLNMFGSSDLRLEGNAVLRERLGGTWTSLTLLHGAMLQQPLDGNGDRFLDLPLSSSVNLLQRFHGMAFDEVETQLLIGYTVDEREGGTGRGATLAPEELAAEPEEYGVRLRSDQLRVSGKFGYLLSVDEPASIGLQWSLTGFRQNGWYGTRTYDGRQRTGYLNFLFDDGNVSGAHRVRAGVSLLIEEVVETFDGRRLARMERVPGLFGEYTFAPVEELAVVGGLRVDHSSIAGAFVTPRLHVRYTPAEDWVLRAVAGRGQRMASVYAENVSVLASSRALIMPEGEYPFGPEIAWNAGMNVTHYFLWDYREATVTLDVYRTGFARQVVVDVDSDPQEVRFGNLGGRSFSTSVQLELNIQPVEDLETRAAYRYLDVRQSQDGVLRERPLVARHRAFLNLAYRTGGEGESARMVYDFTLQWFGEKRLPDTRSNPEGLRRDERSPAFLLVNAQATRSFTPLLDVYLGVENLLDFRQSDPILDPGNPQGPYFDTSLVWGPVAGRMVYLGLRWKVGPMKIEE